MELKLGRRKIYLLFFYTVRAAFIEKVDVCTFFKNKLRESLTESL